MSGPAVSFDAWGSICKLLGIDKNRQITSLELRIAVDEIVTVKITEFVRKDDMQLPELVTQKFFLQVMDEAQPVALGKRDKGNLIDTTSCGDQVETYARKPDQTNLEDAGYVWMPHRK